VVCASVSTQGGLVEHAPGGVGSVKWRSLGVRRLVEHTNESDREAGGANGSAYLYLPASSGTRYQ
jgi:hypothetical protein